MLYQSATIVHRLWGSHFSKTKYCCSIVTHNCISSFFVLLQIFKKQGKFLELWDIFMHCLFVKESYSICGWTTMKWSRPLNQASVRVTLVIFTFLFLPFFPGQNINWQFHPSIVAVAFGKTYIAFFQIGLIILIDSVVGNWFDDTVVGSVQFRVPINLPIPQNFKSRFFEITLLLSYIFFFF